MGFYTHTHLIFVLSEKVHQFIDKSVHTVLQDPLKNTERSRIYKKKQCCNFVICLSVNASTYFLKNHPCCGFWIGIELQTCVLYVWVITTRSNFGRGKSFREELKALTSCPDREQWNMHCCYSNRSITICHPKWVWPWLVKSSVANCAKRVYRGDAGLHALLLDWYCCEVKDLHYTCKNKFEQAVNVNVCLNLPLPWHSSETFAAWRLVKITG